MSIFNKNPNETAFAGGKKNWAEVIKNSGAGNLLIWRQPEEDFNTNSTLIVMPGEEAIFIKGGNIEQVFDSGTYTLSTENYPVISRLRNAFFGGISTFNCVVYFVRKAHSMEIIWGTTSPITAFDRFLGVETKFVSRGSYKIQIDNPQKFLTKLMGNNVNYIDQQELLNDYFSMEFQGKIRSSITTIINNMSGPFFGLEALLETFAEAIEQHISDTFSDYGIKLIKFVVAALEITDDVYREQLKKALADKGTMNMLGEDWGRQQAANILGTLAANPGSGGMANMAGGLGMGMAAGGIFGNMAQQMFNPMQQQQASPTPHQPSGRFNQKSTETASNGSKDDPVESLKKLKEMLDLGLIDQAEFDTKKTEIMNRM